MGRILVFCGSNAGRDPRHLQLAVSLGATIARRRLGLVFGGGRVGLMGAVADAVLSGGGHVTGVIPEHLVAAEIAHPGVTSLEVVGSMHERKARMVALATGAIALPGGYGTFEEALELLTWNQLGLVACPVVFLDGDGFFDPLFELFDRAVDERFVRDSHRGLAQRARTAGEAVDLATAPVAEVAPKWLDRA